MDLKSKIINDNEIFVNTPNDYNGDEYKVSIFIIKFKCLTCGKTFDMFEETLFSRDKDDYNNPNRGQFYGILMANALIFY